MLNRLMFIYFMEKKGFLDGNINYLQERLVLCQREIEGDRFYTFYRYFLLRLFHDGLGKQARTPELEKLLGKIPYLNGGLFEAHPLEQTNTIYEPVRKGVDIDLLEQIAVGISNVSQRDNWNKSASAEYALPTETWREHIAWRSRCLDLREKLKNGEVNTINDLITYNLDIRQFAQDAIA